MIYIIKNVRTKMRNSFNYMPDYANQIKIYTLYIVLNNVYVRIYCQNYLYIAIRIYYLKCLFLKVILNPTVVLSKI